MIIDTHVHLNDDQYKECLEEVICESVSQDVTTFCLMATDYQSSLSAIALAKKLHQKSFNGKKINCFPFIGVYPGDILKEEETKDPHKLDWIDQLIEEHKDFIKGIGEIGIDLYWDKSQKEEQIAFFKAQLDKAAFYHLPVSIHAREATQVTLDILKEYKGKVTGVMHCYSGSIEIARELVKLGYKLGIGGSLTYKNSKLWEVIDALDLSHFVTETDGPYLPPVPHRGEMNKSAYIPLIIKKISEIKNRDEEEVKEILAKNAKEIFNL